MCPMYERCSNKSPFGDPRDYVRKHKVHSLGVGPILNRIGRVLYGILKRKRGFSLWPLIALVSQSSLILGLGNRQTLRFTIVNRLRRWPIQCNAWREVGSAHYRAMCLNYIAHRQWYLMWPTLIWSRIRWSGMPFKCTLHLLKERILTTTRWTTSTHSLSPSPQDRVHCVGIYNWRLSWQSRPPKQEIHRSIL